jgi:hypothetical protein
MPDPQRFASGARRRSTPRRGPHPKPFSLPSPCRQRNQVPLVLRWTWVLTGELLQTKTSFAPRRWATRPLQRLLGAVSLKTAARGPSVGADDAVCQKVPVLRAAQWPDLTGQTSALPLAPAPSGGGIPAGNAPAVFSSRVSCCSALGAGCRAAEGPRDAAGHKARSRLTRQASIRRKLDEVKQKMVESTLWPPDVRCFWTCFQRPPTAGT